MSEEEVDEFLEERGVGVLSLSSRGESYAIPESFGYDGETLYFQLVWDDNSRKMEFVNGTEIATFTSFTEEPAKSVVVRGRIGAVPEEDHKQAASAIATNGSMPTFEVVPETPPSDLSMKFYRLIPEEMSGRRFVDGQ